ncbi:MAG TPA: hypothetical protein DGK99_01060, partial [Acidimicrobiaceae bacterium]|nr:hypothetical protein [Acidimicrobiaceae bacterium]
MASLLGIETGAIIGPLGLEVASSDFTHLVVRVNRLATIVGICPDYE